MLSCEDRAENLKSLAILSNLVKGQGYVKNGIGCR